MEQVITWSNANPDPRCHITWPQSFNTLRPRQNGRHFADDIFKCIFLKENVRISIEISLKFVPRCPINNIPALAQIMAWRRQGDKPLSEPMVVQFTDTYMPHSAWMILTCLIAVSAEDIAPYRCPNRTDPSYVFVGSTVIILASCGTIER